MDSPILWSILAEFSEAQDEERLYVALDRAAHFLGFRQFAMGHHVDLERPVDQAIRLTNYRSDWIDEVIGRSYFRNDPVHAASVRCVTAFAWSQIPDLVNLTPLQVSILRSAQSYGLSEGLTVPVHVPGEYRGTCSFGGPDKLIHAKALPLAHLLGTYAFEAARRIMRTKQRPGGGTGGMPRLTERQIDVLVELGRGKSDAEIAINLGIAQSTAHEHVEAIRLAYGGAQRTYLIGRALFDGQLTYVDIMHVN